MATQRQHLTVEGRRILISNLNKVLYPGLRFTKAQVIDYYIQISAYLLPHLKNHPVTLKRFPEGVFGEFFYEKDAPSFAPNWIKTFPVPRKDKNEPDIKYVLINDLPTLVWLAGLANLEIHPFLHCVPKIEQPTSIVFDCDPGEGADILSCARVAILLHELLGDFGLESLAKVSGSKGIQVYVPLNSSIIYGLTQSFAKAVAELLEQRNPRLIVSRMPKVFRAKKVFIDWSQNAIFKTTVGVYSLRAKSHKPYVSVPVGWDELRLAFEQSSADNLYFEPARTLKRVEQLGDLFAPLLSKVQTLPREVLKYFKKTTTKTTDKLEAYVDKRNSRTSERKPDRLSRSSQGGRRRFVVQKHAANQIHYDFRLEMHGVLKSWAVPKGPPPFKQEEKRLAIIAEDRPIEYLDFEGVIPRRQYGSGTVMVWDIGSYELIEGNYYKGFLRIHLEGSKLKGEWCLQRSAGEKREKWEIEKTNGSMRAISRIRDDQSALSSRSMGEIRDAGDSPWGSN